MPIAQVFQGSKGPRWPIKSWTADVEDSALDQLENLGALPFIHKHIAVMPDVHGGIGSTIGSVIATKNAIIPAAVGVDIGCGMTAWRTSLTASDLPDNLHALRSAIEAAVPHGRTDNGGSNDRGAWNEAPLDICHQWGHLSKRLTSLKTIHPKLFKGYKGHDVNGLRHLGTLGTGNHFIEVCLDEQQAVWFMLHSGSRGIGNRIGTYFIALAKEDMKKWFIDLPDEDLAYLPVGTDHFNDYIEAMTWAQDFASLNRQIMMERTVGAFGLALGKTFKCDMEVINCHHNYATMENHYGANVWVTRKGAVRAREGDLGIIPGSMGTGSFIVRGKGNPESFNSCSHGAGRRMGRKQAARTFTVADLEAQTAGIECRKDADVLDEIPGAYKDINEVMANQTDLVDVVYRLKQVINVKG